MTVIHEPIVPRCGMTIEEASACILEAWQTFLQKEAQTKTASPGRPTSQPPKALSDQPPLPRYYYSFQQTLRDCGWCIGHSHGYSGLQKLWDHVIDHAPKGTNTGALGKRMDFAWAFIEGWQP